MQSNDPAEIDGSEVLDRKFYTHIANMGD